MNNDYYKGFLEESEKSISEGSAPSSYCLKECSNINSQLLSLLSSSLCRSLENLDEELARFEKFFSVGNNSIFWASDYNDVFLFLKRIIKFHKAKKVRLPNINSSTIFRELGIKYFLQDEKMILADDAEIQFFAVDMMFSDTGTLLLLNQSSNLQSKLSNSSINVFFATIDKICSSSSWAEVLQQVASYGNGVARQDMILFKSSPNCTNYLFIIDNQRTNILKDKFLRKSLSCLNCGRCNDVCPVYQTIGNVPYNNVFVGPIANIVLPYLETVDSYKHLTYSCTLCGRCEQVCPLGLPLRDMNIHVRNNYLSDNVLEKEDRRLISVLRKLSSSRNKLNGMRFMKRHLLMKYLSSPMRKYRQIPSFALETFNRSYKKKNLNE